MKFLALVSAVLLVSLCVASAGPLTSEQYEFLFTRYAQTYGREYEVTKFFHRYNIFKSNLDYILAHNAANTDFELAMNEFGDMTAEEFASTMLGSRPQLESAITDLSEFAVPHDDSQESNADSKDWRTSGAVTPVLNQGTCGSCWTYATAGVIETAYKRARGSLVQLSKQQLLDCATATGNYGCRGGWMTNAYKWINNNKGICSENAYPYVGRETACRKCTPTTDVVRTYLVPTKNENALKSAVDKNTVAVAVDAGSTNFQFYKSGILSSGCGTKINHAVIVVGYGVQAGTNYWIVKNSWGTSWGEQGYIRMKRGVNICGISEYTPSYVDAK